MKILQDNTNKDIFIRRDELDIFQELQEKLGITFTKRGDGKYTEQQWECIMMLQDYLIEEFYTEWTPKELYDAELDDVMEELGVSHKETYREQEGPFHELQDENGNVYGG